MFCTKCGTEIPDNADFCPHCGCNTIRLDHIKKDVSGQASSAQTNDSVLNDNEISLDELMPVVGENTDYYIKQFDRLQKGKKAEFNWSAFQYSIFLCSYRKCYELLKILALSLIPFVSGCFMITLSSIFELRNFFLIGGILLVGGLIWWLIASIWSGIVFNKKYYQHCLTTLSLGDTEKYGTSIKNAIISFVIFLLLI